MATFAAAIGAAFAGNGQELLNVAILGMAVLYARLAQYLVSSKNEEFWRGPAIVRNPRHGRSTTERAACDLF
ncbi:MAG: hypothetical protein EXR07_05605 [Acetobacteraceae bacterium]|nr:hypothetical protein [Acetobacteraceae bacterium]